MLKTVLLGTFRKHEKYGQNFSFKKYSLICQNTHLKKAENRVKFEPGTCIHSDHTGPYAKSLGGCRYSKLYMDLGSGFLCASCVRCYSLSNHRRALHKALAKQTANA